MELVVPQSSNLSGHAFLTHCRADENPLVAVLLAEAEAHALPPAQAAARATTWIKYFVLVSVT